MTAPPNATKKRYKVSPVYGTEPCADCSSRAEAERLAMLCAAHYNMEMRVHDRQTGSLRVYDPQRRRWFCQP